MRPLIEMHVRDVPFHLPLVGAYSRFGWSHPGPAQYLLLSVPYRLMAGASWSLPAATLIMNIAAVVGAWRVARSIDESAGRVVLLGPWHWWRSGIRPASEVGGTRVSV
ncbi:MAG: hypothetical protein R2735_05375 [Microthrixaceae bacterium]